MLYKTNHILDKCYNYSIKTQSRCSYSCADSQVGWQVADAKVIQKSLSFSKRMWSNMYNFCREANQVGWTNCMHIIHPRSTIFGTHILTMSIINNIKKIFISDQNILCMCTQYNFTILAYRTLLIIIVKVIYKDDKFINVVTILNVVYD